MGSIDRVRQSRVKSDTENNKKKMFKYNRLPYMWNLNE